MKDFKTIIFLIIVSTFCALILGGVEIAYINASNIFNVRLYKSVLDMVNIPAEEKEVENVFLSNFEINKVGNTDYYILKDKGTIVFKTEGSGLWSRIELLLAIHSDRERLYGMKILSQAETPGLGGRIVEKEFQTQFSDVEIVPEIRIVKFASGPNEVDAITGATKTSNAVEVIINKALKKMNQDLNQ